MSESNFVVREAVPDDAEQLLEHVYAICDEPGLSVTVARDEFTMSVDDERKFVADCAASRNSVFLVAEQAGQIIGLLVAHGGKRRAVQHESVISISVHAAWRGKGVGTTVMAACVDWARRGGVVTPRTEGLHAQRGRNSTLRAVRLRPRRRSPPCRFQRRAVRGQPFHGLAPVSVSGAVACLIAR